MDGPRLPSATVFYISIATAGETTQDVYFNAASFVKKKNNL